MPALLRPFTGYIPTCELAHRVVGPPTSTLTAEQRQAARNDPLSFRYGAGRRAARPQAEAAAWLAECHRQGAVRPVGPAIVVYEQDDGNRPVTGIIADLALSAYDSGLARRHENIIAKTQRKMADYMRTTRMYGNPAALAHRPHSDIQAAIDVHTRREPDTAFATADGLNHRIWVIEGTEAEDLCQGFDDVAYITDGHHRLAAAGLVAAEEGRAGACLPMGLFSTEAVSLRSFARCVLDPDLDANAAIARLRTECRMQEVSEIAARPKARSEFGIRIGERYFLLQIDRSSIPTDPYDSLDVNLLQDLILGPVFGITDPGHDKRLSFVADLSEDSEPDKESDVWILPFPALVGDVMAVADSGRVMPAKSTLFSPKLPSGLVIRPLDSA